MKKKFLLFGLIATMISCSDDDAKKSDTIDPAANNVLLLKVDYQTNAFEGGKELTFEDAQNFTIEPVYNSPGDFGDITLKYGELDENIFAGTITWMGMGERTYPANLDAVNSFGVADSILPMPALSQFEKVEYGQNGAYPEEINYPAIWAAISDLQKVIAYRASNPDAKISLFLYTPAVGGVDEAAADWYVILKN
ncbi:MAG: hypothetical protein EOO45_20585 [Flavobacterium sp.]|nr:MAG: hypothetical protein EOO45_20585 [Flavobacterium sp.]